MPMGSAAVVHLSKREHNKITSALAQVKLTQAKVVAEAVPLPQLVN